MKSKRRHELQENTLGTELGDLVAFFKRRGAAIAWGLLIAGAIIVIFFYVRDRSQRKALDLQNQYNKAIADVSLTPGERASLLEQLAAQDDSDRIAAMSLIAMGNSRMLQASDAAGDVDQQQGLAELAGEHFRQVLSRFPNMKVQTAKAHIGLAVLAEDRRDFDAAQAEYEAVTTDAGLAGQPVYQRALQGLRSLGTMAEPVVMATTAPAEPEAEGDEETESDSAASGNSPDDAPAE